MGYLYSRDKNIVVLDKLHSLNYNTVEVYFNYFFSFVENLFILPPSTHKEGGLITAFQKVNNPRLKLVGLW